VGRRIAAICGDLLRPVPLELKVVVLVNRDVPGFIGNRLQFALWREAMHIVESGIADAATIDTVVRETFGRRLRILGPLANADYIGLELTRDIMTNVLPGLCRAPASPVNLERLLADGRLGARTGEGFLDWAPGPVADLTSRLSGSLARSGVERASNH
jgi:3-hydroxybutyryl-CoA dehydrogenase